MFNGIGTNLWRASAEWAVVAAAATIAAAARTAVIAQVPVSSMFSDMAEYWDRAVYLYAHGALFPDSWRMPGLPAMIALSFVGAGGPSVVAARLLNVAAGSATAALTYWLARRTAGRSAAFGAAVVVALYPTLLIYSTVVSTESVVLVPLLGALVAATYETRLAAGLAGAMVGLAVLVRPASVALLPAVLAGIWYGSRGRAVDDRLARVTACLLATACVMVPWWMHTYRLHREVVALDTTGGLNLLIGSGPISTGYWDLSIVSRLQNEYLVGIDVASPSGSAKAASMALDFALGNPAEWLGLVPAKLAGLFAIEGREHAYLYSVGYLGARRALTVQLWAAAILSAFPLLLSAALAGLTPRSGISLRVAVPVIAFLVCATGLHLLTFGDPRFHVVFIPALAVISTGVARPRDTPMWRVGIAAAIVVLLLPAWSRQLMNYLRFLPDLYAPDGWRHPLSFDALL